MSDILIQFVRDNVWCNPEQDQELVIKPEKVAGQEASFREVQYMGRSIPMPNLVNSYYVYQIGTYYESPDQLPLGQHTWEREKWFPLTKPLEEDNLITYLYTDLGIRFPLFRSYYIYTKEKALLIAVEKNALFPANLDSEDLYVRFYRNAFYDSVRSEDHDYSLIYFGQVLTSASQISAINATIASLTATRGAAFLFINGRYHHRPTPAFAGSGNFVEYIYDPTVKAIDNVSLSVCPSFSSTLDGEDKVLLVPNTEHYRSETIEFFNDTEMYITSSTGINSTFGLWFPIVSSKSIRMIAETIYSLRKEAILQLSTYVDEQNPTSIAHDPKIKIHFRHAGYVRPIVANTNLTEDLKFLTVPQIRTVLTQTPALYLPMSAPVMEAGAYPKVMSSMRHEVSQILSEEALGYEGMAEGFGHTLTKVTVNGTSRTVPIPVSYNKACTGYEYNLAGLFMEYHSVQDQNVYSATNTSCNMVELIKGTGTARSSVRCGDSPLLFNAGYSHRVYACPKISGEPTFEWTDITETNQYVIDTNDNTIRFTNPSDPRFMMVRDDSTFTVQNEAPTWSDGLMTFTLKEEIDRGVGVAFEYLDLQVPGTDLEVILNQRTLVRNVDFFVKFPHVFITNFNHVRQPVESSYQNLHTRVTGLGRGVEEFEPVFIKGQISHGLVGNDDEYVPHYDKALRAVIDGTVRQIETIKFAQDHPSAVDPTNTLNGRIYQVQPYSVPVGDLTLHGESLRRTNQEEQVELISFMDNYYEPVVRPPETLATPYVLVCPFYNKIISDLVNDVIPPSATNPSNNDSQIQAAISAYEWLLEVSPCNVNNGLRTSRYSLRPHPYTQVFSIGSADKLNFLQRVLGLYTPGAFILNTYVSI